MIIKQSLGVKRCMKMHENAFLGLVGKGLHLAEPCLYVFRIVLTVLFYQNSAFQFETFDVSFNKVWFLCPNCIQVYRYNTLYKSCSSYKTS